MNNSTNVKVCPKSFKSGAWMLSLGEQNENVLPEAKV